MDEVGKDNFDELNDVLLVINQYFQDDLMSLDAESLETYYELIEKKHEILRNMRMYKNVKRKNC